MLVAQSSQWEALTPVTTEMPWRTTSGRTYKTYDVKEYLLCFTQNTLVKCLPQTQRLNMGIVKCPTDAHAQTTPFKKMWFG